MARLHYCTNGVSVTEQVLKYQESRNPQDYLPVQEYYNDYKDHWHNQVDDYLDRQTFDSEFDYKLCKAVHSFKIETADSIAKEMGYTRIGAFNGWFYTILANWKSNVKTSSFRLKKRPSVQCPICGRFVARIDAEHLEHYRGISDLPKFFVYKGDIYETSAVPRVNAVTWGKKTQVKWRALQRANTKEYASEKKRVAWPWKLSNGQKGVMCPFTKNIVPQITVEYIQTLDNEHSRYADHFTYAEYAEQYPKSLMQSEIYSLDRASFEGDTKVSLKDYISQDQRFSSSLPSFGYDDICKGEIPPAFEHAFHTIDQVVINESDRTILKLITIGYSVEDISETLEMDRKEIRRRLRLVRDNGASDMKRLLIG